MRAGIAEVIKHGFALDAPWDVVEHKATATEASVTGRYQISKHSPEMRAKWPADAILQVRYSLAGRRLTMGITAMLSLRGKMPVTIRVAFGAFL